MTNDECRMPNGSSPVAFQSYSRMLKRIGLSSAAVLAASTLLSASAATFWTVATQTDFLKGDVENLSIDSDGRVFLGPATTQVAETSAPFIWTLLPGADGTLC